VSTALEFVRALRIAPDLARLSMVVSIYQASESPSKLFDKVCVIYEGQAYFGPEAGLGRRRKTRILMHHECAHRGVEKDQCFRAALILSAFISY